MSSPVQATSVGSGHSFLVGGFKVIYVFSHPGVPYHEGRLKVGDATLETSKDLEDFTEEELQEAIEKVAHARIRQYHSTADIQYRLEHVELATIDNGDGTKTSFRDYAVHGVLERSGFKKTFSREDKNSGEWFQITVDQACAAIAAVKEGESHIIESGQSFVKPAIVLRAEQEDAVKKTLRIFKRGSIENPKRMLWNAKMRFGKTLTAYDLVKKLDEQQGIKRVLIITHRPDVNDSWTEDFRKSGLKDLAWRFGSKKNNSDWSNVSRNEKFVWFASIQDLRGSYASDSINDASFDNLKKNHELFATNFDLIVVDEAHEGNLTELSKRMTKALKAPYMLDLSGTPFNLLQAETWEDEELAARFTYDEVYNWSYPDERKAKLKYAEDHPNDPNPYASLPEVKFITYDVSETLSKLPRDTKGVDVSFTELFRTNRSDQRLKLSFSSPSSSHADGEAAAFTEITSEKIIEPGDFIHEEAILDLLSKIRGDKKYSSDPRLFPFSGTFRNQFNHTLWMLPSVDACVALEKLLNDERSGFDAYNVVNATGRGSEAWSDDTALNSVKKAIKQAGSIRGKTITLSYRMLTTGVTVPEWTAVFMLNNVTSPMAYMQTAFRTASPGSLQDGRVKETAYIFDFNPNRCLREIVETAKWNAKTPDETKGSEDEGKTQTEIDADAAREYLSYISLLSQEGSIFVEPDTDSILARLNEIYVNEVVSKGFDSPLLWNNRELIRFDIHRRNILETLRKLQGGSLDKRAGAVEVSKYSEDDEEKLKEYARRDRDSKNKDIDPPVVGLTEEERADQAELNARKKQEQKNRQNGIGVLVGIAARMPMLVFAAPAEERITPSNFAELIDEESWREFMPKNLRRLMPEGVKSLDEDPERLSGDENSQVLYWNDVKRFFNEEIFWRACDRIRTITREIESKSVIERKFRKDMLFTTFRNPDKETVLTPARVVSLQYVKTLGGLNYYDLDNSTAQVWMVYLRNLESGELETREANQALDVLDEGTHELAPVWVSSDVDPVENDGKDFWENRELSIYDINSKTALYPLQAAVSIWWANRRAHREWAREESARLGEDFSRYTEEELDEILWEDVVEHAVYANTRVDYSRKIAQRVLAGFDEKLLEIVGKNVTTIDVIKLKRAVDGWEKMRKRERPDYWESIGDVYEFVGKVLRLRNTGFMENKLGTDALEKLRAVGVLDAVNDVVGKIDTGDWTMVDISKLREAVEKAVSIKRFDAAVGNPPYQMKGDGEATFDQAIYPDFMFVAQKVSEFVSLIYPAKWHSGGGRGEGLRALRDSELKSKHYIKFYDYTNSDRFFENASIAGGLNIFLWSYSKLSGSLLYSSNDSEFLEKDILSDREYLVRNPSDELLRQKLSISRSMRDITYANNLFGTQGSAWENVNKLRDDGSGVIAWLVAEKGSGIDSVPVKISPTLDEVKSWKVFGSRTAHSLSSTGKSRHDRLFVGAPNQVSSFSFMRYGQFGTLQEATNCLRYLKTDFVNHLHSVLTLTQNTAKRNMLTVPLLNFLTGEILDKPGVFLNFNPPSDTTHEDLQHFLDDQLAEIYELSEDERELMRKDLKPWRDKWNVEAN